MQAKERIFALKESDILNVIATHQTEENVNILRIFSSSEKSRI